MERLKNKVAVITGAGNGIGEVTAKLFADEGASVAVFDIDEQNGIRVTDEINAVHPGKAVCVKIDVADEENWKSAMQQVKNAFGKIHIVVNNAGVSYTETIEQTTKESWDKTIAVNQTGVYLGMKYGIEAMREHGEPSAIVSTASVDGIMGDPVYFSYCGTKAAVQAMTRCAALFCCENKLNIRVNAVAPGFVLTPMAYDDAAQSGLTIEEYCEEASVMHPIGRLAQPIEIANAYLFMVSDEASFVTGTTLAADGGYTCK